MKALTTKITSSLPILGQFTKLKIIFLIYLVSKMGVTVKTECFLLLNLFKTYSFCILRTNNNFKRSSTWYEWSFSTDIIIIQLLFCSECYTIIAYYETLIKCYTMCKL